MDNTMPTMENGTKKGNGMIITTIIASVIAICGMGFGVYGMIQSMNKDNQIKDLKVQIKNSDGTVTTIETPKIETNTSNGSTITITDMPESVDRDQEVKDLVRTMQEELRKHFRYSWVQTTFGNGTKIIIPDTDIRTMANRSYGIYVYTGENNSGISEESRTAIQNAYTYTESVLNSNGFVGEEDMFGNFFYNTSNGISCVVYMSDPFQATCSKNTWISEEDKKLVLELAKASNTNFVSARTSQITDSQVAPYQKLIASGMNSAMLFYRTSPDSEWQFFKGTQDALACSEYTGDVAKAFAGEKCYLDEYGQESTVQP